jgi:integrase/recombinase XerD
MTLDELFEQFLLEKQYVQNCAPNTIKHFRGSYKTYRRFVQADQISQLTLNQFLVEARKAGVSVGALNSYLRGFNSFLDWLFEQELTPTHLRIKLLRQERKVLRSFSTEELKRMVAFKPRTFGERRIYTLTLALMDSGCRIDELLSLRRDGLDFDNLLMTVRGKGSKERVIPMSLEFRRLILRHLKTHDFEYVFPSKNGAKWNYQNCYRDFTSWLEGMKIEPIGFHALRRTYAKNYLRNGGNLFYLQAVLGHSRLDTTKTYVEVETEALKEAHLRTSLLTRLK